jgi:phospholipase C
MEPNISPWRRAVCGDLTSAFDFKTSNHGPFVAALPATATTAAKAAALRHLVAPTPPSERVAPVQDAGVRPSRPLPYVLAVEEDIGDGATRLVFRNDGAAGAVFHVYDRSRLDLAPRRYTVEAGRRLTGTWDGGDHDLWVLGPNGFHRRFVGQGAPTVATAVRLDRRTGSLTIDVRNSSQTTHPLRVAPVAYGHPSWTANLKPGAMATWRWTLAKTGGWYDFEVTLAGDDRFRRRFAGRLETGRASTSDPAMHGAADMGRATRV